MDDLSKQMFKEFLINGTLGKFTPKLTVQAARDICETANEKITMSPVGQEGFEYGPLLICGDWGPNYRNSQINRIGVNFWISLSTGLLSEVGWYEVLSSMQRKEVYALLKEMQIPFKERIIHSEEGASYNEEISIGQVPQAILAFHGNPNVPYNITWFRDGLDESDYPYTVELREPD